MMSSGGSSGVSSKATVKILPPIVTSSEEAGMGEWGNVDMETWANGN